MQKVLVVDDNDAFTELVGMVFGSQYQVFKSSDGMEGMQLALREKPDVILLDVMMPKVSGVEMLRQLQQDPSTKSIPVVILTASQFDPSTKATFEHEPNVNSFLRKPCSVEVLRREIEAALAKRRQ